MLGETFLEEMMLGAKPERVIGSQPGKEGGVNSGKGYVLQS